MATSLANTQSRAELSASRARIIAAADQTRRRLERDLHDGIQQRLVWLGLKAQMIQTMTPRPADNIQRELSLLADGLFTALDELREISHGIHPAVLSEAGLGPALEALARRSAVRVELDLSGAIDVAAERARLAKDLAAAQKERDVNNTKLLNDSFVSKAPEQVIAKVRDIFDVELNLRNVFECPSVSELAAKIESLMIAKLETMSED